MPILSVESQWQQQIEQRRRIIRVMFIGLLVFLLLLLALWFWFTQPLLFNSTPSATSAVDPSRLEAHVRKLSIELAPRDEGHIENLDGVAAYIREQFEQAGARVFEQPYRIEGKSYRNVIAQFGPENSERIIVGAHYDTAGPLPGADDNAGYPAVMITDTAFYRNRNYHTEHDTAEKLDYKRMAMVVEGVFAAVMEMSR